jgi:hypothetical protein
MRMSPEYLKACAENEGGRAALCMVGYGNPDTAAYFAREAARYARLLAATVETAPRRLALSLLPGRPIAPGFDAYCVTCETTTGHAGICGDRGQELGAHCLWCGQKGRK